ncbi:hypothetical protein VTH06DRAFT_7484 [Thermothelomyces fergusii]
MVNDRRERGVQDVEEEICHAPILDYLLFDGIIHTLATPSVELPLWTANGVTVHCTRSKPELPKTPRQFETGPRQLPMPDLENPDGYSDDTKIGVSTIT